MKTYAEEGIMSQHRKKLISSFTLQNGTLITPLPMFYLQPGLVVTKIHRFVEYIPKCFNSFVQPEVDARRQGDENPNSSVTAKTMMLLANISYGSQIRDRSRHAVTKYLSDEKTHAAINSKLFKKLEQLSSEQLIVWSWTRQSTDWTQKTNHCRVLWSSISKTPNVGFLLWLFTKFCGVNKFEELEMETDSRYLALADKELEDCTRPQMKAEWKELRSKDCTDSFTADKVGK